MEDRDLNLFKSMMDSIRSKHSRGNAIRYFKLPLIFLDARLYGGAIGQFYLLTSTLELEMDKRISGGNEMIQFLKDELDLKPVAPGYEMDLQQLFGLDWKIKVEKLKTSSTEKYIHDIIKATDIELCTAVFILYGALVVGGGKSTQRKAKKVVKSCDHALFDISDDIVKSRKKFKAAFRALGEKYPEYFDEYVSNAQKFMGKNNEVVLSIRCLPFWWWNAVGVVGTMIASVYFFPQKQK